MQIYICHDVWIEIQMTDNYIHLPFKVKALQKYQDDKRCVLRENSNV